jgi:hypothetical protein
VAENHQRLSFVLSTAHSELKLGQKPFVYGIAFVRPVQPEPSDAVP